MPGVLSGPLVGGMCRGLCRGIDSIYDTVLLSFTIMMTLPLFYRTEHLILPHVRPKAMYDALDPLRRLWDERYYATEDGEALFLALYYRFVAAQELSRSGKRLVGDMA